MKLEAIQRDLDQLGERIDQGLETDRVVVWLFAIVGALIRYLVEKEGEPKRVSQNSNNNSG